MGIQKHGAIFAGLILSSYSLGQSNTAVPPSEAEDIIEPYPLFSDEPPALPQGDEQSPNGQKSSGPNPSEYSDMPKSIMEMDSENAEVNGTVAQEKKWLEQGSEGDMNEAPDQPRRKQWRLGPSISLSFPYFISPSLEWTVGKAFSAGLSHGTLKTSKDLGTSFDSIELNVKSTDLRMRYHPFQEDFFMGLAFGSLDLNIKGKKKTTTEADGQTVSGAVLSNSRIKSNYITPHLGWFNVYDSGFCFGFELGYHIPLKANSTFSANAEDPNLDAALKTSEEFKDQQKDLDSMVKKLGKTAIPYVNLLRIGWLY
jgi:hypothetical protein